MAPEVLGQCGCRIFFAKYATTQEWVASTSPHKKNGIDSVDGLENIVEVEER